MTLKYGVCSLFFKQIIYGQKFGDDAAAMLIFEYTKSGNKDPKQLFFSFACATKYAHFFA